MSVKDVHKLKLLEFLGNPENDFPYRCRMGKILGVTKKTLYQHFTPTELSEIEAEAVQMRKDASSRQRMMVLESLYKRAIGFSHPETKINVIDGEIVKTMVTKVYPPDRAAAQEFLDRTEGKVIDKTEITGKDGAALIPIMNVEFTTD